MSADEEIIMPISVAAMKNEDTLADHWRVARETFIGKTFNFRDEQCWEAFCTATSEGIWWKW